MIKTSNFSLTYSYLVVHHLSQNHGQNQTWVFSSEAVRAVFMAIHDVPLTLHDVPLILPHANTPHHTPHHHAIIHRHNPHLF